MLRRILALLGYRIEYRAWGRNWAHRYDGIDAAMGRPIHPQMSVAPPWATRHFVRIKGE